MAEENKWYLSPQGWVAVLTVTAMVFGAFLVRERQMWENSSRIAAIELRGDKAIVSITTRLERIEQSLGEGRDRLNFLERKIDHLEFDVKELKEDKKGYQQPYQ
jgi:hypothetical protein